MKRLIRLCREPLVHFMLIGAGLFLLFGLTRTQGGEAPNRIVVDVGQVEQLAAQFKRTWLRFPTEEERVRLVEAHVRDEVYYREALAMGLDRDDPQVRRRMRMKLEFLLEDLTVDQNPGDQQLSEFLQLHPDLFRVEPQVSFDQLYLSPDKHPDFEADAQDALERLKRGAAPGSVGDQTLLQYEYRLATQSDVTRSFGDEFAVAVVSLEPGNWTGPLYSRLGIHLVRVHERTEGRLPELGEVRAQVEREYLAQRRKGQRDLAYQQLRQGYEVVVETEVAVEGGPGEAVAATRPAEKGQ